MIKIGDMTLGDVSMLCYNSECCDCALNGLLFDCGHLIAHSKGRNKKTLVRDIAEEQVFKYIGDMTLGEIAELCLKRVKCTDCFSCKLHYVPIACKQLAAEAKDNPDATVRQYITENELEREIYG